MTQQLFTIYSLATGQILRSGFIAADCVQDQVQAGEGVLLQAATFAQYVVDGALADLPPQPSAHHTFDWTLKQWVDPRTLADLKAAKNDEINAARLRANQSTFTHAGKVIAFDAVSQKDIELTNGEVNNTGAMPAVWPGGWKALDNSFVPITTVAEWRAFYSSIYAQGGRNFAHSQQLKAQLQAAATAEQVAAIAWQNA
jgi:hypothetical protein